MHWREAQNIAKFCIYSPSFENGYPRTDTFSSTKNIFILKEPSGFLLVLKNDLESLAETSLENMIFLADIISYQHDMPTVVLPVDFILATDALTTDFLSEGYTPSFLNSRTYFDNILDSMRITYGIRTGFRPTYLKYIDNKNELKKFNKYYLHKDEVISLYAMATKQTDFLMEYLCLYRVIEHIDGSNGVKLLNRLLDTFDATNFGYIDIQDNKKILNIIDIYKNSSKKCLDKIYIDNFNVGSYLYKLRNSIAHGKNNFAIQNDNNNYEKIVESLPLLKLLTRKSIDEIYT